MKAETIVLNKARNVTLTAYVQEVGGEFRNIPKRPAVLVLPGGGYAYCSDREADPVALAYLTAGYQTFILRYSVGAHKDWPNPLEDVEQAVALIRSHAEEWGLYGDKLAVVGFSAGGHLAACAATMAKNRPNAAIIGYGVTIGSDIQKCNPTAPDVVSAVSRDTCPCFVFSSRRDTVVPIVNATRFVHALTEQDVAVEAHIYAYGPHGFSTAISCVNPPDTQLCDRAPHWVSDSIHWLRDVFGDFGDGKLTEPAFRLHMDDNAERFFSVDCTPSYLMERPETAAVLKPILEQMMVAAPKNADSGLQVTPDMLIGLFGSMTLRDMLAAGNIPQAEIDRVDAALREILKEN